MTHRLQEAPECWLRPCLEGETYRLLGAFLSGI